MKTITYYAANSTMGCTSADDCDQYRAWAEEKLNHEYPEYSVDVSDRESLVSAYTNDEENRDEIIDFCSRLWDRCPWDWCE